MILILANSKPKCQSKEIKNGLGATYLQVWFRLIPLEISQKNDPNAVELNIVLRYMQTDKCSESITSIIDASKLLYLLIDKLSSRVSR